MKKEAESYVRAMALLPAGLQDQVRLSEALMAKAEEMRLRIGRPASAVLPDGELITGTRPITREDIGGVIEIATGASAYTARDSFKAGYITARGGVRVGVAGSAVTKDGEITGFRAVSSVAIRVSREFVGVADKVAPELMPDGKFCSTLIISPPGGGKTTLLRDMVRLLSDGEPDFGIKGRRVSLADERGEVAGMMDGVPQKNVGARTDVIDGCSKDRAVIMMLRAMNPEIIAIDEITDPGDIAAIECAANCGVKLLATAHAENLDDLKSRRMYLRLLHTGVFKKAVFIEKSGGKRVYRVRELRGDYR